MRYDEFLSRLDRISLNRSQFAREAGIRPSTTYNWRKIGVPVWGEALLRQHETIAFTIAAVTAFIDLAEHGRLDELRTHAYELTQSPEWRNANG